MHRAGILLVLSLATFAQADNWPQWRGPNNDGISKEKNVPVKWSRTENVAWKLAMPGIGGSTPVVWGDRIFLTSAKGEEELVAICVSTSGKVLWERSLGGGNKMNRGDEGNLAAPSPSTDGKHVYIGAGNGTLACFDFEGQEVWRLNLEERYGKFKIQFGMTSTPVLDGDRLYVQLIHGEGDPKTREAIVAALDTRTGKGVWKQERPSEAYGENEHSYASPVVYRDGKQAFLLTHGADYIVAHDMQDGHELWRCGGFHPISYNAALRLVTSPVAVPGLIVVPTAKNGPVLAIKPGGKGDITNSREFRPWTRKDNTPDVPSPLVHGGLVYLCRENGNLLVLEAESGKEVYEKATTRDRHRSSPLYADGHVYLCARNGAVTVVKAGREFEIVSVNKLDESLSASPALSNGRFYFRTFESLYAIGAAPAAASSR